MSSSPTMGIELHPFAEDLYELCFVRDPRLELSQGVLSKFPHLDEYSNKDLFSKYPTEEGLWHFERRSDDVIICSTGTKINPMAMEGLLNAHSLIESVIMCGSGRLRASLLVEARYSPTNEKERKALLEEIWKTVEKGNQNEQAHGRIEEDLIVFTKAGKPMVRAGKVTVLRKVAEELYGEELDGLYTAFQG